MIISYLLELRRLSFLDASSHLYKRVCPSVRPSVRYACAKTAIFGCFWPRWDPTLNLLRDKHVLRASITTLDGRLSVLPSVYPYMSHDQYTQRHSPDASLPVRACFFLGRGEGGFTIGDALILENIHGKPLHHCMITTTMVASDKVTRRRRPGLVALQ